MKQRKRAGKCETAASNTNDDKRGKTFKVAVEVTFSGLNQLDNLFRKTRELSLTTATLKKTPRGQMLGYLRSNKTSKIKLKINGTYGVRSCQIYPEILR